MEVFGREINLDIDLKAELSEKQIKILIFAASILVFVVVMMPAVVFPIMKIMEENKQIEQLNQKLQGAQATYLKEKKKYDTQFSIYQEQKEDLDLLRVKFENSSLEDETSLKFMIDDLARYLGVSVSAIGRVEVAEDKEGYTKKYTPYVVKGTVANVSKLFYYLENSNFLITMRGAGVQLTRSGRDAKDRSIVEVRFKVGAYFIEEGGEIGFE